LIYRGESARKDSIAGPEVLAQQQAVMAAVEAEIKQKNSVENPSAFSTVSILYQLAHKTSLRSKLRTYYITTYLIKNIHFEQSKLNTTFSR